MLLLRIKKLQLLCGLCMILQLVYLKWYIPFHLIGVLLSIIIIIDQPYFKVIQPQYHYYVIGLYLYRLWLLSINSFYFLEIVYVVLCLYLGVMLLLFAFHCLLK